MTTKQKSFSTRKPLTILALSFAVLAGGLFAGTASAGEIVKANFDVYKQAASQQRPIIMHIHAPWCPVCAKQGPILEALMKEPEFKNVIIFKIDFEADKGLVDQLEVKNQSTLIASKGALEVDRIAGVTDKDKIREFIRKAL